MRAALDAPRRARRGRPHGRRARRHGRARARRAAAITREVGRAADELGVDVLVAVGDARARLRAGRQWVAATADGRREAARASCVAARRRRARQGARARWGSRRRRGTRDDTPSGPVLIAGPRRDAHLDRRSARSSSSSCAGTSSASTSARRGRRGHVAKQGTPSMGGLLILLAAIDRVPRASQYTLPGAHRLLRDARLRARSASSTTSSSSATAARSASRAAGSCCCSPRSRSSSASSSHDHGASTTRLRPGARRSIPLSWGWYVAPVPRDRRRRERREPHRRARRPRGGRRDHRAVHVHGDERDRLHPLGPVGHRSDDRRSISRSSARR